MQTAFGQGVAQPSPGARVAPLGRCDQLHRRRVGPQADGEPLQDVAHPARSEPQSAVHPLDGAVVAGEDGHPQIGAVRLGCRADERPVGGAAGQGVQRRSGNTRAVVVFDQQQIVGPPRQQFAQRIGAIRRKRCAGGVLSAVGEHQRTHPAAQRPGQVVGQRAVVVDPYRLGRKPQCGKEIEEVGPAGILDGDPIAGAQVRGERAFDAVQRAAGHGQVIGGDPVRGQRAAGELLQLGQTAPARRRAPGWPAPEPAGEAPAMGNRAGFGLPVDRSRTPAGTSRPSSERGVVAGRWRTRVPRRPAVSTAPR